MDAGAGRPRISGRDPGQRRGRRSRSLSLRGVRRLTLFVDTSALYARLSLDDERHEAAKAGFEELHVRRETLLTHNYVVVETSALVRQRLGVAAERALHDEVLPVITLDWVDHDLHASAVTALLASRRRASLVDWVSFELMRRRGIDIAFTFDRDFRLQGFRTLP